MATARQENFYLAKVAEQAERFDDMARFMERLVKAVPEGEEISVDERNMLTLSYKNVISSRRSAWRIVSSIEAKDSRGVDLLHQDAIRYYRSRIEAELQGICLGILKILDERLIPSASSYISKIFFLKLKGDYHRYLAEFLTGDPREDAVDNTRCAYKAAQAISADRLPPANPIRLGVALNHSVFHYEILNSHDMACTVAKEAFDLAVDGLDTLSDEDYKDSTLIMQLLRDNLTLWTAEMKDEVLEEFQAKFKVEE
ncbi:14-3-3-like protein GF14 omega [Wolffia australiana]